MSEFGDEGGESPSEGGDNKYDEVPDEGLFNPNDDVPDESPDEGLFNPNDDVPDESPDEGLFNPNDDVPDESPDEGLFNPNDDVPDESPDEELFNPNDDVPDDNPDNELDDPIKEYESESEPEKQPEGINNPSNSGNVSVIEPVQTPEYESEEKPEEFEVVTPNGELERAGESPEVMEIRADLEEWGYEPEYDSEMEPKSEYEQEPEQIPEQELETDPGQEQEEHVAQEEFKRDKEGNIVLDAEQMKLFGSRVSSQEEMEVEFLEEELEELFDSYEEQGLENDRVLETSIELEQESSQEQLEPEQETQEFNRQQQEEKVNQEMERAQEQELSQELSEKSQAEVSHTSKIIDPKSMEIIREKDEKENVQESSRKKIQENEQELVWEKEQSQEQNQEIEQESIREINQNIEVIQEEIQEQIEEQKEPTLRESDEFFEEQYKQETGRRPIYAGKETRGFIEWKEHLNEKEEKQEEKNKLLQEKEKEIKRQSKEIRESKEEWAQYLANSIKGAEFPENIKVELNELLEKYEDLRKLLEKLKNREIAEEKFEKEVKEFEHILIEKRHIARPLFMNFDWFRRYYIGMIRKAGKRVAHLYISKKTREFLYYLSGRIEQLQNIGNSHENAEKFKEFLEKSFQIKEKWALLLNRLIRETLNKEISTEVKEELGAVINMFCKIRAILFNKDILEEDKNKLIQERIEKCNPRFFELFEILKRFLGAYDNYSRKWMEQSLIIEGKTTVRRLSQKLKAIKEEAVQEILNGDNSMLHKFKEILRVNLYKSTELNMNEKSKLIKIIQKKDISEEDRKVIKSLLGSLSKRELTTLLKNDFKNYFLPKPDLSSGVNETSPLKYSFNRNDNNATRLIKTILNQMYENKRALEQYHFRQKEKNEFTFLKGKDIFYPQQEVLGSISLYNLGKFLGVSRSKARNWLIALDQNRIIKLPDLEFRKIRAAILRFFQGEGESIVKSRQIIEFVIDTYMDKCYHKMDFIAKIVLLLDDSAIWEKIEHSKEDPHSLLSISKRMGMNPNYLSEIKKRLRKTESYTYSKYFTLATNIILLKYKSFKFKNKKNCENFKIGALDIVFQEMVRQGIFSDENADIMRKQYEALVYTLYALAKARYKRLSLLELKPFSMGKDNKGIYTLSDLSREIGGRKLFADYLLYEAFISRETLAKIKKLLDENKVYASIECEFALNLLNEIPRIRLGQRPSYVGRRSHPILENFFRKLWLKLGIISKHEYQFNYPNSLHRIDSTLEVSTQQKLIDLLKSSSDSSLSKFKTLFIDYTIPNLVRFNICVLDKISPEKKYLAKNRSVILVFYGIYSEKIFKTLQMKLNSLKLDYKKNIRFMDITKFIQLFTNNADELRELDEINTLIKKALDDDNEEALEELDRKADDALFDLSKYNK